MKLVGPIISCEGAAREGNVDDIWRTNPHVQSYAFAMDRQAISIMEAEGYVLRCHKDRAAAIFDGEIGSSRAILDAGYNLDSFLMR